MLRRLLLLFCSACLVAGIGATIGGGMGAAQVGGCGPTPTPTPSPTPTGSPAPCDTTPATCKMVGVTAGPPKQQNVSAQDTGSGLQVVTNINITNGTVFVPSFTVGTTQPIIITATKTDQALPTVWSFDVVDVAGNVKHCS